MKGLSRADFIEEALSVERYAGEKAVIYDPLHRIGIAGIDCGQRHTLCKHRQGNGGAGLCIGGLVRQIAVNRERLADAGRADAARDIHTVLRYILKYTVRSGKQLSVAALIGDIRHGAVDITGSDAVSGGLRLLAQGYHILKIVLGGKAARLSPVLFVVAALIHKEAAEVEPAFFARAAVQTHKSKLYLGMTRGR